MIGVGADLLTPFDTGPTHVLVIVDLQLTVIIEDVTVLTLLMIDTTVGETAPTRQMIVTTVDEIVPTHQMIDTIDSKIDTTHLRIVIVGGVTGPTLHMTLGMVHRMIDTIEGTVTVLFLEALHPLDQGEVQGEATHVASAPVPRGVTHEALPL